ncbi:hypothetical protein MTR67_032398 [Solanum verrucosum]|uniref:Chromo domain-containing protein n=1 Tax=Solanum verrucosum TaxID=315347 RepID=A0AAF0U4B8_SOLVR|nr:hypothetical protein MTR67_032398 [Solanum verrucosum]
MKGVMRFGKKGKLSPRYIGPYRISKIMGNVAYELELPQELATDSLLYEEIPVRILDCQVRKLRAKEVASVKVLWRNQFVEEATWEAEEDMKKRYPHIFESGENADQVSQTNSSLEVNNSVRVPTMSKTHVIKISIQRIVDPIEHSESVVEEDQLKDREKFKNKRAKTSGNEFGHQKSNVNRSSFQHKQKGHSLSSASAPAPRNKYLTTTYCTNVSTIVRILRTSKVDLRIRKVVRHKRVLRLLHVLSVVEATQGVMVMETMEPSLFQLLYQTELYLDELLQGQAEEETVFMLSLVAKSKKIRQMLSLRESIVIVPFSVNHKSIMADVVELDMGVGSEHDMQPTTIDR